MRKVKYTSKAQIYLHMMRKILNFTSGAEFINQKYILIALLVKFSPRVNFHAWLPSRSKERVMMHK